MLMDTRPPRGDGGPRPWEGEPNRVAWRDQATGLQCLIRRNHLGVLCGYVRVPRDHPLHGVDYRQRRAWRSLHAHGGLTFSGRARRGRDLRRGHWFGFDCGHAFDFVPGMQALYDTMPPDLLEALTAHQAHDVYRTVDYVRNECTNLAAQLARKAKP